MEDLQNKKILNVGAGLEKYGTHRIDVFPNPNLTEIGNVENGLPYPENFFDEVYAKNIFEHMKNPFNMLLEMKRVCKPGGRIRIITDNGNFVLYLWNLMGIKHSDYRFCGDKIRPDDRHYMFFQLGHLRNYFDAAGLKIISNELRPNVYCKRDRTLQKIMSFFITKHFGMPHIEIVGEKEQKDGKEMAAGAGK
jgi:SAM-dependent methyltransferase